MLHPTFHPDHRYFNFYLSFLVNRSDLCSCIRGCGLVVFPCQKEFSLSNYIFIQNHEYRIFLLSFMPTTSALAVAVVQQHGRFHPLQFLFNTARKIWKYCHKSPLSICQVPFQERFQFLHAKI